MTKASKRLFSTAACALAVAAAGLCVPAVSSATATCHNYTTNSYPGDGYITSLTVTGTSCSDGLKVAKSYYNCRVGNGGRSGHCNHTVYGYKCTEGTRSAISTEFNARVTCKKGSSTIVHTYQQNL